MRAPAKLNLGLEIVGRRVDGYHELQSLFWPIDFVDPIELEQTPGRIEVKSWWGPEAPRPHPTPPQGKKNLVHSVLESSGGGWSAGIEKNIPIGAGLGGGSADAGTVLAHLMKWGADGRDAEKLGADIPFFLDPRPTWVKGIGELRQPLAQGNWSFFFLLIIPPKPLSTRKVFQTYQALGGPFSTRRSSWEPMEEYLLSATNDLTPAAIQLYPLVGEILTELKRTSPLFASLTGTGSTCFAIFRSAEDREKSIKVLQPFLRKNFCRSLLASSYTAA